MDYVGLQRLSKTYTHWISLRLIDTSAFSLDWDFLVAVILESSANNPVVLSLMQFCRTLIELCGILQVTLSTHVIKCLFKVFGANVKGEKLQTFYDWYCHSTKMMKISLQYLRSNLGTQTYLWSPLLSNRKVIFRMERSGDQKYVCVPRLLLKRLFQSSKMPDWSVKSRNRPGLWSDISDRTRLSFQLHFSRKY